MRDEGAIRCARVDGGVRDAVAVTAHVTGRCAAWARGAGARTRQREERKMMAGCSLLLSRPSFLFSLSLAAHAPSHPTHTSPAHTLTRRALTVPCPTPPSTTRPCWLRLVRESGRRREGERGLASVAMSPSPRATPSSETPARAHAPPRTTRRRAVFLPAHRLEPERGRAHRAPGFAAISFLPLPLPQNATRTFRPAPRSPAPTPLPSPPHRSTGRPGRPYPAARRARVGGRPAPARGRDDTAGVVVLLLRLCLPPAGRGRRPAPARGRPRCCSCPAPGGSRADQVSFAGRKGRGKGESEEANAPGWREGCPDPLSPTRFSQHPFSIPPFP